MNINIRFRIDKEEQFITDTYNYQLNDWNELIKIIQQLEWHGNTILEIIQLDIDGNPIGQ